MYFTGSVILCRVLGVGDTVNITSTLHFAAVRFNMPTNVVNAIALVLIFPR